MGKGKTGGEWLRYAPFGNVKENGVFRGAAIRHQHQEWKLIALRQGSHAGAHAEHTCILNKEGSAHAAEADTARDGQRFLFMSCSHELDGWLLLDTHEKIAEPAVWARNHGAEAKAF